MVMLEKTDVPLKNYAFLVELCLIPYRQRPLLHLLPGVA